MRLFPAFVQLLLLLLPLFVPGQLRAAPAMRVAIMDLDTGASEHAERRAWISSAVVELLQAKMQLFEGCRLMERSRLRSIVPKIGETGAKNDRIAELVSLVPAEVLILGSVTYRKAGGSEVVKVRLRAVETATSEIISDTAFAALTDLPGLLAVAEKAARELADGLGFAYTSAQLQYVEPKAIEALNHHLEGVDHLANRRYREAIDSFQTALDNNGGSFYPAAHSAQGEAYRLLAGAGSGVEAEEVKKEYLEKFRRDALLASPALFDLGLAYETNEMWAEAADAYRDYISAIGSEGTILRWSTNVALPGGLSSQGFVPEGKSRLHILDEIGPTSRRADLGGAGDTRNWMTYDLATGELVREVGREKLGEIIGAVGKFTFRIIGFDGETALAWWKQDDSKTLRVVAISPDLDLLWAARMEGSGRPYRAGYGSGMIYFLFAGFGGSSMVTLDGSDGSVLSRIHPPEGSQREDRAARWGRLERERGTWTTAAGLVFDLETGDLLERLAGDGIHRPGGRDGISVIERGGTVRVMSGTAEEAVFEGGSTVQLPGGLSEGLPLLFRQPGGFALFDTEEMRVVSIPDLAASNKPPVAIGLNDRYVVFVVTEQSSMQIFDRKTGELLGKHSTRPQKISYFTLLDEDMVFIRDGKLYRIKAVPEGAIGIIPAAVARLHIGNTLIEAGDLEGAMKEADLFDGELPGDFRGKMLRMRIASREGDAERAARWATRALATGEVGPGDREACLETLRVQRPDIIDIIVTPTRSRLEPRSVSESGLIVCTAQRDQDNVFHVLVDTKEESSTIHETPFLTWDAFKERQQQSEEDDYDDYDEDEKSYLIGHMIYRGGAAYATTMEPPSLIRYDFTSGEITEAESVGSFPYWATGFHLATLNSDSREIEIRDADTLDVLSTTSIEDLAPAAVYLNEKWIVLTDAGGFQSRNQQEKKRFVVADRATGEAHGEVVLSLDREQVRGLALHDSRLYFTVNGLDWDRFSTVGDGHWYRYEAYDVAGGENIWSHRQEGWAASNPVVHSGEVTFIAHNGPFEGHVWKEWKGVREAHFKNRPSLLKIRVDPDSGEITGSGDFSEEAFLEKPRKALVLKKSAYGFLRRHLFSNGNDLSRYTGDSFQPYWSFGAGTEAVAVAPESVGTHYMVGGRIGVGLLKGGSYATYRSGEPGQLFWEGKAYESIGGGVLIVKDLSRGGASPLSPHTPYRVGNRHKATIIYDNGSRETIQ